MIGKLTSVDERLAGSELDAGVSAGATTLIPFDPDDFDPEGGDLTLDDGTNSETVPYTFDEDTEELTVPALANAYAAETPITLPGVVERWASLIEPDSEEELEARVPHALYDRFPVGVRPTDTGEVVQAEYLDDELVVADMLFQAPVIDGSFIDPDTVVGGTQIPLLDDFNRDDASPPSADWINLTASAYNFTDSSPLELVDSRILGPSGGDYDGNGYDGAVFPTPAVVGFRVTELDNGSGADYADMYLDLVEAPGSANARVSVSVEPRAWYMGGDGHLLGLAEFNDANALVDSAQGTAFVEAGDEILLVYNRDTAEGWLRKPGGTYEREVTLDVTGDVGAPLTAAPALGSGGTGHAAFDDFRGGGGYMDAGGAFVAVELSDGIPPASSPTPVVTGGPRWLAVNWDEVANADQVTYDVHVSTSSGFTPNSTTLAGTTVGTVLFLRLEADGTPLEYDTTYYVKLVARDVDGDAAAGAQDSAALDPNAPDDLAVGSVTAEKLEAVLVLATMLATDTSGQRVEIDEDGIRLINSSDEIMVDLPVVGDPVFAGVVEALGLDLDAGTGAAPTDENRVRWLRQSDGALLAEAVAYENADGDAVTEFSARDPGSGDDAIARLMAKGASGTPPKLEVIDDGSNGKVRVTAGGFADQTILDASKQSMFLQLVGGGTSPDRIEFNMGTQNVSAPGGAAAFTSSTISHGLGGTPEGIMVVHDANAGSGNGLTNVNPRDVGSSTFTVRAQTVDASNIPSGLVTIYWLAWRKP